jgi:hypothetical protein
VVNRQEDGIIDAEIIAFMSLSPCLSSEDNMHLSTLLNNYFHKETTACFVPFFVFPPSSSSVPRPLLIWGRQNKRATTSHDAAPLTSNYWYRILSSSLQYHHHHYSHGHRSAGLGNKERIIHTGGGDASQDERDI